MKYLSKISVIVLFAISSFACQTDIIDENTQLPIQESLFPKDLNPENTMETMIPQTVVSI